MDPEALPGVIGRLSNRLPDGTGEKRARGRAETPVFDAMRS
jgi:hypothetical protein